MSAYFDRAIRSVIQGLEAVPIDHLVYVPDAYTDPIIRHFESSAAVRSIVVCREEEGVGIAAGLIMAGRRPALLIQDTGIGNSMVALTTFAQAYGVPLLVVASRRGGIGEINTAVNTFSEDVPALLRASDIHAFTLDYRVPSEAWAGVVQGAHGYAALTHGPVFVLLNLKESGGSSGGTH